MHSLTEDSLRHLLRRLSEERVEYALIGGQALRLHGYLRATEDVDLLVSPGIENGARLKRALAHLSASAEIDEAWFTPQSGCALENIRIADEMVVDVLFAANGFDYVALKPYIRDVDAGGVTVKLLDVDGLLLSKTDWREKDILDKQVLMRLKQAQ